MQNNNIIQNVQYLIYHPSEKNRLVYPSDVDDEMYVGFGAFFLVGVDDSDIRGEYNFIAVYAGQFISSTLHRIAKNFFRVKIENIGSFIFFAQYLNKNIKFGELIALRRLRSRKINMLEKVCIDNGFYFVGFSPRIPASEIPMLPSAPTNP